MPGFKFRRTQAEAPRTAYMPIGLSQQIMDGDVVVLSDAADEDAGHQVCLRVLHPVDITKLYASIDDAGTTVGVYGVALQSATADASGVATGVPSGVTLAGDTVAYPIPSMARAVASEPYGGHSRLLVALFDDDSEFGGTLVETTTVNEELVGLAVGISLTPASGTAIRPFKYQWSTAASTKIGTIVGVNRADPLYNKSGGGGEVFVRILPAYQQYQISADYYSQSRTYAA